MKRLTRVLAIATPLAVAFLSSSCTIVDPGESPPGDPERAAVEATLERWHDAASRADGATYFGLMTPDAVFLGTDAKERWTREEFRAYAEPFFSQGRGWTYDALERHVFVRGSTAWIDERLWNEKYGECRGTGVLVRSGDGWHVAHYNLTFPVPNELALEVVQLIRASG